MDRIRSAVKSAIRSEKCGFDPIRRECGSDIGFAGDIRALTPFTPPQTSSPLSPSLCRRHHPPIIVLLLLPSPIRRCSNQIVAVLCSNRSANRRSAQTCQICSSARRLASLAASPLRSSLPLIVTAYHLCPIAAFPLGSNL
ncbi:hypothetical protein PIB30_048498 [Stylosanthes scabra]|uniref:Uncharacterized protein n=1 Tax=Stylosanthes scabra TaxID=79078 RepID=A0ABU6THQ2_9FABA|nr:hypothetical protein [Stylosanthes scabra]